MMKNIIKIMALNIGNPSEKRVKEQIRWIESRDEDVFLLTETKNSKGCNLLESYFLDFGYNLFSTGTHAKYYVSFPKSITNDLGVMCISKLPIKKMSHYIPQDNQYYARLLEVNIFRGVRKMHVVGVYVPSRDKSEEKIRRKKVFLDILSSRIKEIQHLPCIICGDFNIVDRNHIPKYNAYMDWEYDFYEHLLQLGYIDAFKMCHPSQNEYSWVGRTNNGYRYDYFFVSQDLAENIKDCYFVHETRKLKLTDHSAIVLEVKSENTSKALSVKE